MHFIMISIDEERDAITDTAKNNAKDNVLNLFPIEQYLQSQK